MKKRYFYFIAIFFLIPSSIFIHAENETEMDFTSSSSFLKEENNLSNSVNNKIVRINEKLDKNQNKIHDLLDNKIEQKKLKEQTDLIVSFSKKISNLEIEKLNRLGIEIVKKFDVIYAAHIRGTIEQIKSMKELPFVKFINEDSTGRTQLLDGTEMIGARTVWQPSLGYGYTGNPNTAIAILDTGIDDSHIDNNFNLVYYKDFVGHNYSVEGDEYSEPNDIFGHGSHCASIALSKGSEFRNETFKLQDTYILPESPNFYYSTSISLSEPDLINIKYNHEGDGLCFIQIWDTEINEITWSNIDNPFESQSGEIEIEIDKAGRYKIFFGNKAGLKNVVLETQVTFNASWNANDKTYGPFTGVAPNSNLVGLKVHDDYGWGTGSQLIEGIDWLYNHGQEYNVTVASISLLFDKVIPALDSAISSLINNKGIICVICAGNEGTSSGGLKSPSSCKDAITVGAVNKAQQIAYYSSVGNKSKYVDVVAPGGTYAYVDTKSPNQKIIAADSNDGEVFYSWDKNQYVIEEDTYKNNFKELAGTSMSTPFVAGIAQLIVDAMIEKGIWSYSGEIAKKIKQIICMGTFEVKNAGGGESYDGDDDDIPQTPKLNRISKDKTEGWGMVSATAAIQALTSWLEVNEKETVHFDANPKGNHVEIRQINLSANTVYQLISETEEATNLDSDILIFDTEPQETGDPQILAHATNDSLNFDHSIFTVPTNGTYYLVARWVAGEKIGDCSVRVKQLINNISHVNGAEIEGRSEIKFDFNDQYINSIQYNWNNRKNKTLSDDYIVKTPMSKGEQTLNLYIQSKTDLIYHLEYSYISTSRVHFGILLPIAALAFIIVVLQKMKNN